MNDIIFISKNLNDTKLKKLRERWPLIKHATSFNNAKKKAFTKMFWIIPNDVLVSENFNFDYIVPIWDSEFVHLFKNGNEYTNGISLVPRSIILSDEDFYNNNFINTKLIQIEASTPLLFDIVFISFHEKNADDNYETLLLHAPRAKRIDNVIGIHQAHIEAAKIVETDMFWVVDGDAIIINNFKFDYYVPRENREDVYIWRSINPINNLIYGYGGVKLLPTALVKNVNSQTIDMTTSICNRIRIIQEISNITAFNTDEFNTWRSAFRECAKLASSIIHGSVLTENDNRLAAWQTANNHAAFGKYAIDGALAGIAYGNTNKLDLTELHKINDIEWMRYLFIQHTTGT